MRSFSERMESAQLIRSVPGRESTLGESERPRLEDSRRSNDQAEETHPGDGEQPACDYVRWVMPREIDESRAVRCHEDGSDRVEPTR